jgi:hypothetical protein
MAHVVEMPHEPTRKSKDKDYSIQADLLMRDRLYGERRDEVEGVQFHAYDPNGVAIGNKLTVTFPIVSGISGREAQIKFVRPYSRFGGDTVVWSEDDTLVYAELHEVAAAFAKVLNDQAGPEIKKAIAEAERRREQQLKEYEERRKLEREQYERYRVARAEYQEKLTAWNADMEEHLQWYVGPVEMRLKRKGKSGGISIREIHSVTNGQLSVTTIKGRHRRYQFTEIEELSNREGERRYSPIDLPLGDEPEWKDPRLEEATTS